MVVGTDVAALAALLASLTLADALAQPTLTLVLIGLAALVSARPVRVATARLEIVANDVLIFLALAGVGPTAAGLVILGSVLGASIGRGRMPKPMHLAFNLGAACLSAVGAAFVFRALAPAGAITMASSAYPLAVATTVYLLSHTGLVAAAVAVERQRSFLAVWGRTLRWAAVPHLAGLVLAFVMLPTLGTSLSWGILFSVPVGWVVMWYCHARKERLESVAESAV